jgi:hypothetical protein
MFEVQPARATQLTLRSHSGALRFPSL